MRRAIVGTAGHIDHGKTKLVEALTGIDCDRWAEEKRRGITIDLGFAHLEADDLELGFIDVPGHEKFVHNALAGLGGIRVLLLVVAADEAVKPQTREHLAIARLLPIPAAIVALTKIDLVSPELAEVARLEIQKLLADTRFAGAPILPVSSVSGQGVDALRRTLLERAAENAQPEEPGLPLRLPIDRVFHLTGKGVIVTGTLVSGEVAEGMSLLLAPAGKTIRIRSIEVHGGRRANAAAGQRVAARLAGIDLDEIHRGDYLLSENAFEETKSLVIDFQLLGDAGRPLAGATDAKLHLFSSEVVARLKPLTGPIRPGSTGLVEARLRRPLPAVRGDHVIVRRLSPAVTLGGGRILDPRWRRPRSSHLGETLAALSSDVEDSVAWWVEEAKERGLAAAELSRRLGRDEAYSKTLLEGGLKQGKLILAKSGRRPARYLSIDAVERLEKRARAALQEFFARNRLAAGMPKAEFVSTILPARGRPLADFYLAWLEERGVVSVSADRVAPPDHASALSTSESQLAGEIVQRFESAGLTPPSPPAIASELGAKPQIVAGVTRFLVERGRLVRLPGGLILAASSLEKLRQDLAASGWTTFSVGQFKERYGLSRKWAIPLLEHLDSEGVTRRIGDQRMLAKPSG